MIKIMTGTKKRIFIMLVTIGAFLMVLPLFGGSYYIHIFILVFLNTVLASGYRLLTITGLVSFCHITFFGIGAYTSAILATRLGLPFGIGFLAGGILAAIIASLLLLISGRARGPYFFLISFAFWVVIDTVFNNWKSMTGGHAGIHEIPPIIGSGSMTSYYFISLILVAITVFIMYRLDRSRFGTELLAIGDSEELAEAVGINVFRYRMLAFAVGAFFAGLAGSVYAHYVSFICPTTFGLWHTIFIVIWVFVGGERKFWGPVVGAVLMTLIAESLRISGVLQAVLYSVALLVVVMTAPHGIAGLIDTLRLKRARPKNVEAA
jgi:branched-chain amino acid transport system permease protein